MRSSAPSPLSASSRSRPARTKPRLAICLSTLTIALGFVAVTLSPANAHFTIGKFTRNFCDQSPESHKEDPINFIFFGPGGFWDSARLHVEHHAGWGESTGTHQVARSRGHGDWCVEQSAQHADDCGLCDRHHLRFFDAHAEGSNLYTGSDAHYEDFTAECGHAVTANNSDLGSGFNYSRDELRRFMDDSHPDWHWEWRGNTKNLRQCNETRARSDGYAVFMFLGAPA